MPPAFFEVLAAVFAASSIAMADDQPTSEMMEPVEKIARFIANADDGDPSHAMDGSRWQASLC